jgi:hypothetical protein
MAQETVAALLQGEHGSYVVGYSNGKNVFTLALEHLQNEECSRSRRENMSRVRHTTCGSKFIRESVGQTIEIQCLSWPLRE